MAKQKKKKQIKPVSIIVLVVCSCIVLYFGISIVKEAAELKRNDNELNNAVSISESQDAENKALQEALDEGDEAAIAEKYAREKGYVKPDEKVYVDITPGA